MCRAGDLFRAKSFKARVFTAIQEVLVRDFRLNTQTLGEGEGNGRAWIDTSSSDSSHMSVCSTLFSPLLGYANALFQKISEKNLHSIVLL